LPENPENLPQHSPADDAGADAPKRRRSSLAGGVLRHLRAVGREMLAVTTGKWRQGEEEQAGGGDSEADANDHTEKLEKRVNILHNVTEKLRGAADSYIAAKMDEIEARVDAKLGHIEKQIDRKILELHKQLAEARDRELKHRLRLLKLTLIFTVLVALISLVYNWISTHWIV
jgi:hypothetical protein